MNFTRIIIKWTGLLVLILFPYELAIGDGVIFFESKIRPALVKYCYECHSSASNELGGSLSLEFRDDILRGGESGPAIVKGNPKDSLLIRAIRGNDDLAMPPKDKGPLPEGVIQNFVEWVEMGAPDSRAGKIANPKPKEQLWSLEPVSERSLPEVNDLEWPSDRIDHFILHKLESKKLLPAKDALPQTLVRRLYYDLIGLAPSMEEINAFALEYKRDSDEAVSALVDELLSSQHFGERWGRHWLDIARYGESNGNDGLGRNATFPHAWRFRDYVIDSFNRDVPYDRFIKEQIAGDLLSVDDVEERNRNLVATGFLAIGAKPAKAMNENFAMDVVDDQINVVTTALLGMSVSCARCHDHKHDPILSKDYYGLAGIFKSTETLWGKAANEPLTAPSTPLHELLDRLPDNESSKSTVPVFPSELKEATEGFNPVVYSTLKEATNEIALEKGISLSVENYAKCNKGRMRVKATVPYDNYSVSFWFRNDTGNSSQPITAYLFSYAKDGDDEQAGENIGIGGKHDKSVTGKLFIWNGKELNQSIAGSNEIAEGSWNHIVMVRANDRVRLYLNGEKDPEIDSEIKIAKNPGREIFVGSRNDNFAPLNGQLAEFAIFDRALAIEEVKRLHAASGQKVGAIQKGWAMGARDKKKIEDCKININGNSKKLGAVVSRGFPNSIGSKADSFSIGPDSSGRLQLAEWIVSEQHPLTSRVFVNRVWQHLFGRGIVNTPDDFGIYGSRPSHPALLDDLARRFMNENWSIKKLIKIIVLSRTYQLDSHIQDEGLLLMDPDNIFAGRHSRRRLDAETNRDRILQASENLVVGSTNGSAIDKLDILLNWPPGEAKYLHQVSNHRSIYLCMLRDAPPPELVAFNLPDGFSVKGLREKTDIPTQALFYLNSPLVVEQSKIIANNVMGVEKVFDKNHVKQIYLKVLRRLPSDDETVTAIGLVERVRSKIHGDDVLVRSCASFCQVLLASNEFRYID
ncbi:MAG TPA: DUF1549 domain-containing protein [Verrucomicrobia bacterium]|jgi:hypothetical protein|nr:DUF1549 domain-containing protein [Verrucomicrobiales bacterium]HIL53840.1 DUF1549 domain-containing protein [Verrucomicrobiota bacterium]